MPPTESCLAKQSRRLTKLPFGPTTEEDAKVILDEFKRVLRPRAISDAHCTAIVDYLLDHAQRCPPPAEVIEACSQVDPVEMQKAPIGCDECQGTGWTRFTRGLYDYAGFCRCALGRWKRDCEQQRKAEEAAKAKR